jgi:hypothetical protein
MALNLVADLRAFREPVVRQAVCVAMILAAASLVVFLLNRQHPEWLVFSAATIAGSDVSAFAS